MQMLLYMRAIKRGVDVYSR